MASGFRARSRNQRAERDSFRVSRIIKDLRRGKFPFPPAERRICVSSVWRVATALQAFLASFSKSPLAFSKLFQRFLWRLYLISRGYNRPRTQNAHLQTFLRLRPRADFALRAERKNSARFGISIMI